MNNKKRVADIVVETLLRLGICDTFCVVGGGSMHLNNAFDINEKMNVLYCHHEQACAMAAECYARYKGTPAAVLVTSGPGGVNALNGVYGAWVDSIPMVVISGFPRYETSAISTGLNLRCRGVQEFDIVTTVKTMTKYSKLVTDPEEVKEELLKAYDIAMDGRRGPVWLSIPLDVQMAEIEDRNISHACFHTDYKPDDGTIQEVITALRKAERPCILTGSGIYTSNATDRFLEFLKIVKLPIVGGALQADILPEGYELYFGGSGSVGPRAGNYILQNSDLILVLGNSMPTKQTGFNVKEFAPKADIVMVDAEKDELKKPDLRIKYGIWCDLRLFFDRCLKLLNGQVLNTDIEWVEYCQNIYDKYIDCDIPDAGDDDRVPAKLFWNEFRKKTPEDAIIVLGNSSCIGGILQLGKKHQRQRVMTNYNDGSMGYDLPAAIGASVASGREVYCVTGDGSFMMNLQELETLQFNKTPVKIVVFSNDGYGAIRQTCKNYFNGRYMGCDKESGVGMPDFEKVAEAFEIKYRHCKVLEDLDDSIEWIIKSEGSLFLEIDQRILDPMLPRLVSKINEEGEFVTPVLTDMYPEVDFEVD